MPRTFCDGSELAGSIINLVGLCRASVVLSTSFPLPGTDPQSEVVGWVLFSAALRKGGVEGDAV